MMTTEETPIAEEIETVIMLHSTIQLLAVKDKNALQKLFKERFVSEHTIIPVEDDHTKDYSYAKFKI